MAESIIEVNTDTLRTDIEDKFRYNIGNLRKDVGKLREVSGQLNTMWEGEAKNTFVAAVEDDTRQLEQLIDAIEKFTTSTDEVRTNYNRCEQAVGELVNSLRI